MNDNEHKEVVRTKISFGHESFLQDEGVDYFDTSGATPYSSSARLFADMAIENDVK